MGGRERTWQAVPGGTVQSVLKQRVTTSKDFGVIAVLPEPPGLPSPGGTEDRAAASPQRAAITPHARRPPASPVGWVA